MARWSLLRSISWSTVSSLASRCSCVSKWSSGPTVSEHRRSHLTYHQGAVAMYTLREHVGEERVNAALRKFLETYRPGVAPNPTSLDSYRELQAVTPDALQPLLHDLFADVILWDVRTKAASVELAANGTWRVTLDVVASNCAPTAPGTRRLCR